MKNTTEFIRWFDQITLEDLPDVGGKNANLGELIRLSQSGQIRVPDGFAVNASAYRQFLSENKLESRIQKILAEHHQPKIIRELIRSSTLPSRLVAEVTLAYEALVKKREGRMDVAVRSSATAEDLPTASFAGLQDTWLNVNGIHDLLDSIRNCYASLYNDRAVSYRNEKKIPHESVSISVAVQEMIRSDLAVSGVLFTIDTETGFENHILIDSSYGLGESIVQGKITPDEFIVAKNLLKPGLTPIIQMKVGSKESKMVYNLDGSSQTMIRSETVPDESRKKFSLTESEILQLARWGAMIENHYETLTQHHSPMDIEWAKDGISGDFFILQARPETIHSVKTRKCNLWQQYTLMEKGRILIEGSSVGSSIQTGIARVIETAKDLEQLQWGEILITDKTDPDWEPAMKKAAAIVTNRGGRTCHAAIVARELGVPAVVGTGNATTILRTGQKITVSSADGSIGKIYEGELRVRITAIPEVNLSELNTRIMMNVGDPDAAAGFSFLPNDGVGLARLEFIINSAIGIHPMAIARFNTLSDPELKRKIQSMAAPYPTPEDFFIKTLSRKTAMIAAAFHPKPVIVRFSDFKSNEYSRLIGGSLFEKTEENPMLGFRGAGRYIDPDYRDGFILECKAMIEAKERIGLDNIRLMIPFCRTIDEAEKVIRELSIQGISREKGYSILMMCEIPSNIILADDFLELFDGYSIGSNDLTQLVLGIDRDSEKVAGSFSERNPAVLKMIEEVILKTKAKGKSIGICGQAPSDDQEFAKFLIRCGIDSVSLNPDSIMRSIPIIRDAEQSLKRMGSERSAKVLPKPQPNAST